jgi:membrane protease YdiL (CAAX protease family)
MAGDDRLSESLGRSESAVREPSKIQRASTFVLYLAGGLLVFLFGSNTYNLFPTNKNAVYEWVLTLALLLLAVFIRESRRLQQYWKVTLALFIASFANALNLLLGNWLAYFLPPAASEAQFIAIDKLSQSIPVVASLVLLTLLFGDNLGSIFLKKGILKQGLSFGLISFGVAAAIFAVIAVLQANAPASQGLAATGVSLQTLLDALPWILVFIFANSLMEELWFRGISIGRLSPILGTAAAVLVTALVFGSMHLGATYITPAQMILFPLIAFALGLVNGYVMLKTGSIWGSVLFHAGYDLFVIIPILAS